MTLDRQRSGRRYWSIRSKLLTLVLAFGFVFTFIAVGVEYSLSYGREENRVQSAFDSVESGFVPALSLSVFEFDNEQTQTLLRGIASFNEIGHVRVEEKREDSYTIVASQGSRGQEQAIRGVYPLNYNYEGQIREVGRLVVSADMNAISERIQKQVLSLLITNATLILLISLLIAILVQRILIRHLEQTDEFARAIQLPAVAPPKLVLNRRGPGSHFRDELDDIAIALNDLTQRVTETYQELDTAREDLTAAVSERETLIRELYHRTKNNMQVIMSMLSLKASHLGHEPIVNQLVTDIRQRIYAMALVHEKLYKGSNLTEINMREYMEELTDYLLAGNGRGDRRIRKAVSIENIDFFLDAAIACGLIVSELLSNSLKHGFPEDQDGTISISLSKTPDHMMRLAVSDDGVGIPPDFNSRRQHSMGIETIYAIGEEQLEGDVTFQSDTGFKCEIVFPITACCLAS